MTRRTLTFRKLQDRLAGACSQLAVLLAVAIMIWILASVCRRGLPAISATFLTEPSKPFGLPDNGIANALLGTLLITGGAALIAIPTALLGGIFLAEFHDWPRLTAAIRFAANVMMGMPSVIVGLFVYLVIVVPTGHFSGLAGSVALALIMLPVIMRTTEDMLLMVPNALREAALALGMTRARTTLHIVCKSARAGLLTGILLAISRVSGETAPLLFTALYADAWPTTYASAPTPNLPVLITEYATNSPFESMHQAGWGAALIAMTLILAVNIASRFLCRRKGQAS